MPETVRDLRGLIDLHIHTAPDVRPRSLDDIEAARQAAAAGMKAIVLKSHVTLTADRAAIAQRVVGGTGQSPVGISLVLGGVALNRTVGGLNPAAVDAALRVGARLIWLPTSSAVTTSPSWEGQPGLSVVDDLGRPLLVLEEICRLVRQADAVLATGHVPPVEIAAVVHVARASGLERVLITHADSPINAVPLDQQRELARAGAVLERTYLSARREHGAARLDEVAAHIRATGIEANALATDFGQAENPPPVEGLRAFLDALAARGFSGDDLARLAGANAARLLGIESGG